MTRGVFVTGTGTDVGKTYISALLVKKWKEYGKKSGYFKGVLSGDTGDISADHRYVQQVAGLEQTPHIPYIYKTPVSPHLASQKEGNPVELDVVVSAYQDMIKTVDYCTVEGSGGIVCPLRYDNNKKYFLTDLLQQLGLPCVVVTSASLGTINGTVLTLEYMKSRGLKVSGIIMNGYEEGKELHGDNWKMVEELTGISVVARVSEGDEELALSREELDILYGGV